MTNVGGPGLLKRVETLHASRNRKPASDLENIAIRFADNPSFSGVRELLGAIGEQGGVRSHRPGILRGAFVRCKWLRVTRDQLFTLLAVSIREQSRALGRPLPRRAVVVPCC